jgi:hypothetical protein
VSSRLDAFKATAPEPMRRLTTNGADDFAAGRTVEIPCGDRTLVIDWSKPPDSAQLVRWVNRG